MYACPQCNLPLQQLRTDRGVLWACDQCKGRAVSFSLLRGQVEKTFMNRLWQDVLAADRAKQTVHRPCPACKKAMAHLPVQGITDSFQLDACRICNFLWFDSGEVAHLPILPPKPDSEPELSPEAKEALALTKVKLLAAQAQKEESQRGTIDFIQLAYDILMRGIR